MRSSTEALQNQSVVQGTLPSGAVKFGTDQTLLESVVRMVREQTGLRVSTIQAHLGGYMRPVYSEHNANPGPDSSCPQYASTSTSISPKSINSSAPTLTGPSSSSRPSDVPVQGQKGVKVYENQYVFLVTIEAGSSASIDHNGEYSGLRSHHPQTVPAEVGGWRWCTWSRLETIRFSSNHQKYLRVAYAKIREMRGDDKVPVSEECYGTISTISSSLDVRWQCRTDPHDITCRTAE